jgi:nicotinate-nucleotide adenylyltransferase
VTVACGSPVTRLGVYGGAFDPPHTAHFALAQAAVDQLRLDRLCIVPTGAAFHKVRALTAANHRLAMCHLAFDLIPEAHVDSREISREGASYTIDTLRDLQSEHPGAEIFLIIGEDQARAFQTWHRWRDITEIAIICVAARADNTGASGQIDSFFPNPGRVQRLQMPISPVNATEIRQLLANSKSVTPLVFESVARYIEQHHLYRTA